MTKTETWDDEDQVRADVDALMFHIRMLQEKYGDRLDLMADDPFCTWGSASIALERDAEEHKPTPSRPYTGVKIVRRSYSNSVPNGA